jgi:hypothetical protein
MKTVSIIFLIVITLCHSLLLVDLDNRVTALEATVQTLGQAKEQAEEDERCKDGCITFIN